MSGRFLLFPPFSSLTGLRIIDRILYPIARPFAGAMGTLFLLMNDNARSYRANILNRFLQAEPSEKLELPSMSLDLNPIEHLNHNKHLNHIEYLNHIEHIWDFQKRHIQQWDPAPSNINELEVVFFNGMRSQCSKDDPFTYSKFLKAVHGCYSNTKGTQSTSTDICWINFCSLT